MIEIENHPFEPFIPENATILIIGSFPGREQTQGINNNEQWFYGSKRNQFWKIISKVYNIELQSKADKQRLFNKYGIAITDVLLKVKRRNNNNLDHNLEIIEFNDKAIKEILNKNNIKSIYFTSKFVQKLFIKLFPELKNIECLPSPSPRYARMKQTDKIDHYKTRLPQ